MGIPSARTGPCASRAGPRAAEKLRSAVARARASEFGPRRRKLSPRNGLGRHRVGRRRPRCPYFAHGFRLRGFEFGLRSFQVDHEGFADEHKGLRTECHGLSVRRGPFKSVSVGLALAHGGLKRACSAPGESGGGGARHGRKLIAKQKTFCSSSAPPRQKG